MYGVQSILYRNNWLYRGFEHIKALGESNKDYSITKHYIDKHPEIYRKVGESFNMSIIDRSRGSNLDIYISECWIGQSMIRRSGG